MTAASEWVSVGDLGSAFEGESNILPQTEVLVGRALVLNFEDGRSERLQFPDKEHMILSADDQTIEVPYSATSPRESIIFLTFRPLAGEPRSVSIVMDLKADIFTAVYGSLPGRDEAKATLLERIASGVELTGVKAEFAHGAINTAMTSQSPRHLTTDDLVNKRVEYVYSASERYEHIYLNARYYTWHCLDGIEKGLADTDRCHYYKIAEQLYLFVWREKIVPTLGIVLVDVEAMKTTGNLLGYEGYDFKSVTSFPVGARARVLNVTSRA